MYDSARSVTVESHFVFARRSISVTIALNCDFPAQRSAYPVTIFSSSRIGNTDVPYEAAALLWSQYQKGMQARDVPRHSNGQMAQTLVGYIQMVCRWGRSKPGTQDCNFCWHYHFAWSLFSVGEVSWQILISLYR